MRRPERLDDFLGACEADARGRTGFEDRDYPQADYLRGAANAARDIHIDSLRQQGLQGPALGEAITQARIHAIMEYKQSWTPSP